MQATILFSMLIFSFSMSISPGPINITILSSSLIYGVKKTLPFISGATIGFTFLLIVTGFGFSKLLILYPFTFKGLAVVGSVFIGYTGYRILSSSAQIQITHPHSQHLSFIMVFCCNGSTLKRGLHVPQGSHFFLFQIVLHH